MKPVFQSNVDPDVGDCQRAVIASLFDLDLDQVPNFRKFNDSEWFKVFYYFLYGLNWIYLGEGRLHSHEFDGKYSVNGYFNASVPSRTFKGKTHGVIIDTKGVVVHDPNPNKLWLGINVVESKKILGWYMMQKNDKHR